MMSWFDISIYVVRYTKAKLANKIQKISHFMRFTEKVSVKQLQTRQHADIRLLKLSFQLMCSANSKSGQNN